MKSVLIVYLAGMMLAFFGCTSTRPSGNLNKLTDQEIEAYNNNPMNADKIVCSTETGIGTRLPKRVCRFESSIDKRARQDQQTLDPIQKTGIQNTRKGGG